MPDTTKNAFTSQAERGVATSIKRSVYMVTAGTLLMISSLYVGSPLGFTFTFAIGAVLVLIGIIGWGITVFYEARAKGMFK